MAIGLGLGLSAGNYVLDVASDEHKIVYGISYLELHDMSFVQYKNEFDKPATFLIEPIPLTLEWLLKFGFNGTDIDNYTIVLSNGNFFILDCPVPIATNIYYVHELQNLYFALTGKQLTV